jgi:hypothetical protein
MESLFLPFPTRELTGEDIVGPHLAVQRYRGRDVKQLLVSRQPRNREHRCKHNYCPDLLCPRRLAADRQKTRERVLLLRILKALNEQGCPGILFASRRSDFNPPP